MKWRFDSKLLCNTDFDHSQRLDECVRREWKNEPHSWQDFLRKLPGFYPLDVWQSLERNGLDSKHLSLAAAGVGRQRYPEAFPHVLEHPLDYEWRFTQETTSAILDALQEVAKDREHTSVVCLGCPSVAVAGEASRPSWRWSLIDRRAHLLRSRSNSMKLINCDLTQEYPELPLQSAAVVDPPWYIPITKHFLVRAQSFLQPGGILLLSFPPEGTRPEVKNELAELLAWCKEGGLEPIPSATTDIFYKTPFFEWSSLNRAGFSARVPAWRRGELLVFRKHAPSRRALRYDGEVASGFGGMWEEFLVEDLKFCVSSVQRVKTSDVHVNACQWNPVWKEDVLPSVSTKFKNRQSANFVTSSNRFLQCSNPQHMADILRNWPSKQACSQCTEAITKIIDSEVQERQEYLRFVYD